MSNKKQKFINPKTGEEFNPYDVDKSSKFPFWLKTTLLKYWFFGAVYFFVGFGMGVVGETLVLAAGIIGGVFYDLVINKIIMLWESDKKEGKHFSMVLSKKYYSMIVNTLYLVVVFFIVGTLVGVLGNFTSNVLNWTFTIGSEPFTFALLVIIIDSICLLIKYFISKLIKKIKDNKKTGN